MDFCSDWSCFVVHSALSVGSIERLRAKRSICFGAKVPDDVRRHMQRQGGDAIGAVALNRVLFSPDELNGSSGIVRLGNDDLRAWHLRNVLKIEDGQTIRAGIVDGPLHNAATVKLEDSFVQVELDAESKNMSAPGVDVLLALPRPGVMGRLWPTLASLGVANIFVVNAYRVEKTYFASKVMREEEIRAGLIEGLMQAGCDTRLPRVLVRKRLKFFLEDELDAFSSPDALRIVGHPGPEARRLSELDLGSEKRILVAIGPEGGWMDREMEMLHRFAFKKVSLGPRALRTEVACSALIALAHDRIAAANTAD